jgi:MATE family multidrug resistance protein
MAISSTDMALSSGFAPRGRSYLVLEEGLALLRLAAPIMLIALVNMGMSVTDTAMVSALFGANALAAVAVGSDLY